VVEHTCNPSTQEAEAGESRVQGEPELHGKATQRAHRSGLWHHGESDLSLLFHPGTQLLISAPHSTCLGWVVSSSESSLHS
jgi:hypothetical protein